MILTVGFIFLSLLYLFIPSFHWEDWRSLAKFLKQNEIKEVYMISSSVDSLIYYYYPQIKIKSLKNCNDRGVFLKKKKIFVIPYASEIFGVNYEKCFKNSYQLIEKKISIR